MVCYDFGSCNYFVKGKMINIYKIGDDLNPVISNKKETCEFLFY